MNDSLDTSVQDEAAWEALMAEAMERQEREAIAEPVIQKCEHPMDKRIGLSAELAAARKRIEELEAALRVYATPNNWCEGTLEDDDGVKWRLQFAEGSPNGYDIAREALDAAR